VKGWNMTYSKELAQSRVVWFTRLAFDVSLQSFLAWSNGQETGHHHARTRSLVKKNRRTSSMRPRGSSDRPMLFAILAKSRAVVHMPEPT
jgi:hypothetical protein